MIPLSLARRSRFVLPAVLAGLLGWIAAGCLAPTPGEGLLGTWHSVRLEGEGIDALAEQTLVFRPDGSVTRIDRVRLDSAPSNHPPWLTRVSSARYQPIPPDKVAIADVLCSYRVETRRVRNRDVTLLHLTVSDGTNVCTSTYGRLN
jgi:hypothetical protein